MQLNRIMTISAGACAILAVAVGLIAGWGALTLTDSHTVEEPH